MIDKTTQEIELLISDLAKSAKQRDKKRKTYFSEELVILRLKAILEDISNGGGQHEQ